MGLVRWILLIWFSWLTILATAQKARSYELLPSAHLQLSYSQEVYAPGDTALFVVRYFNDDLTLIKGSNYITVVVKNDQGEKVYLAKVKILNGIGSGYVIFPSEGEAGIYTTTAYSEIANSRVLHRSIKIVIGNEVIPESMRIVSNSFDLKIEGLKVADEQLKISGTPTSDISDGRIFITSNNEVLFQTAFDYAVGRALIRVVPKNILSAGFHQLYIFGKDPEPLVYREFYLPKEDLVNVNIDLPKKTFLTRDEVALTLSLQAEAASALIGYASMKVMNQSVLGHTQANEDQAIVSLLDALDQQSKERDAVNHYLMSQRGIQVIEDQKSNNQSSKFLKRGRAIHKETGKPLPEGSKILLYFHKSQQLALIKLEEGAEFGFENVSNVHGTDGIFYVAEDFFGFEIEDAYIEWYPDRIVDVISELPNTISEEGNKYATFNRNRKLITQSFSIFANERYTADTEKSFSDRFEAKYIEANDIFDMSKFLTFPTMKETITEIIRPLSVSRYNKKSIIRMNNLTAATPSSSPVYIIDGIMTKDTDYVLSLDPSDLKEVRIYRDRVKLKKLGFLGRNGLIWISTKTGKAGPPIAARDRIIAPKLPLNKEVYRTDSLSPLFESTMYWNSNIVINGKTVVRFRTSDDVGKFLVKVQGITEDGRYFSTQKIIEVEVNNLGTKF